MSNIKLWILRIYEWLSLPVIIYHTFIYTSMLKYSRNINIRLTWPFYLLMYIHKIINHISQTAYIHNIRIILHIYTLYRSNETIIGGRPSIIMRMDYERDYRGIR